MKQFIKLVMLLFVVSHYGCGKEPSIIQPQTPASNYFRIQIKELPGGNTIFQHAYVLLSVINEQNEEVLKNKKLVLGYDGSYKTEKLLLPAGRYQVSTLLVRNSEDSLMYAAPRENSTRAPEVIKPLHIGFGLPAKTDLIVPVEVAGVRQNDLPSDFGYPAGTSWVQPGNPTSEAVTVRVKLSLTIGDILYDSIPCMLKLTVWDKQNQAQLIYTQLNAGTNEVSLPKLANKYSLQIEKWGYAEEKLLDPSKIEANAMYEFKGIMESRKLRSELTYRVTDGLEKPETKNLYFYNLNNTVHQVIYYQKKSDGTPFAAFTDDYFYNGIQLESIRRKDEKGLEKETTLFIRNAEGQPQAIIHSTTAGEITNALVSYTSADGIKGTHVKYNFSHHNNMLDYDMRFVAGNMSESSATRANTTSELGTYQYDQNINPYALMHLEDLFFTHGSKNNVVAQYKQYAGSLPETDVYSYEYSYDNFGYPKQLIRKYRSPLSNQHVFTTKTVYNYD